MTDTLDRRLKDIYSPALAAAQNIKGVILITAGYLSAKFCILACAALYRRRSLAVVIIAYKYRVVPAVFIYLLGLDKLAYNRAVELASLTEICKKPSVRPISLR